MKRCPECRRDYYDDTLSFCLEDGSPLVLGVSGESFDVGESATAILHTSVAPNATPFVPPEFSSDNMFRSASHRTAEAPLASVAVLPFAHLSRDPDDEYFCDGLAEELINTLAKLNDLKVVARSSAFSFKDKNLPISEIGSILNVQHVVEGSVRKFGERMRITVQLINVFDGYHVWSDKYDADMSDLFDVQDQITLAVVNALKAKLLGRSKEQEEMTSLGDLKQRASDVDAYQLYLRGKFFFNKFTPDDFHRSLDFFNRAIEIDPEYAAAYAGLADAHVFLTEFGPVPPLDGMPKAKEAALKALALDPSSADAHLSLGLVLGEFDWNFAEAEKELKRAIELNPNNSIAHQYYGGFLTQLGRHAEAESEFRKASELDPLSPVANWIYPFHLYFTRRYDECIDRARKILELDKDFTAALLVLSFAYEMKRDFSAGVDAYFSFLALCGAREIAAASRSAFEEGGWHAFLRRATTREARAAVTSYMTAAFYLALDDHESAIQFLEESRNKREGHIVMLKVDPRFDKLRADPRFQALLTRIGF